MNETTTSYVGLDIHKDSIAMAIAEAGRSAPRFIGTMTPEPAALCKALTRCTKRSNTLIVYEAGPCGYGWARYLSSQGWRCEVISPAHITRKASEKLIKTDRLDALLLARESRAGNLVRVVVPDERDEAIRDLARAREDASAARLRARLQLKAMLLRHGRAYQGKTSWTAAHERHLAGIKFELPAQQIAFDEYRQAVKDAHERLERLTQALGEQCAHWRMKGVVKALMCLRGLDLIAATIFIAEIGDLSRQLTTSFNTQAETRCARPMRGILGKFYAGTFVVIPALRARQPREEEMKCGSQSADIRMIHRRSHLSRVAFPLRCHASFLSPH